MTTTLPTPKRHFKPTDEVKIGNGYQVWTVLEATEQGLTARASNTYQAIAGKTEQVRTLDPSRATLITRNGRAMTYQGRAREMGVDTDHCNDCHNHVMAALAEDEDDDGQ